VSETKEQPVVSVFRCGTRCSAGGTQEDGGHVFDIPVEEENASYARCRCGTSNMDWAMWSGP
jgi:hypothetical protein